MTATNGSCKTHPSSEDGVMMEEDSEMTSIALPGVLNSKMNNSQLSACISNGSYSNRSPSPAQTQKDSIAKSLTNFDIEVIRIIAQHLRYLGLKLVL